MTTSKRLIWLAAALAAMFAAAAGGQGDPKTKLGTVHVRVVSTYGFHALEATIHLHNELGESYDAHVHGFTIEGIPFGKYQLDVESPMLRTRPVELVVDRETMWATLAFPFTEPVQRWVAKPAPVLKGILESTGRGWIKLVGVYSSTVIETEADERGRFAFSGLPAGLYLLIVTAPNREPVSQMVKMQETGDDVEVRIAFTSPAKKMAPSGP